MTYAIGVEEIFRWTSCELTRFALDRCDLVTVRDPSSEAALRALGFSGEVIVTADPALLLKPTSDGTRTGIRVPEIVVNIREASVGVPGQLVGSRRHDFNASLARSLDRLVSEAGVSVRFVSLCERVGDSDARACEEVQRLMTRSDKGPVLLLQSAQEAVDYLARAEFVIGMRLHSLILAAATGVPFAALGYMPKVAAFAEWCGMTGAVVALDARADLSRLNCVIADAFARRHAAASAMVVRTQQLKKLASLNAEMAAALAFGDEDSVRQHVEDATRVRARLEGSRHD